MTPTLVAVAIMASILGAGRSFAPQLDDPSFSPIVDRPAYFSGKQPVVWIDEAHHNFHTISHGYRAFASLLTHDGYRVEPNTEPFNHRRLKGCSVLVVANALGVEKMNAPGADRAAFTSQECSEITTWVRGGGSLLLVADHYPAGGAADSLARRFGVGMSDGYAADTLHFESAGDPTWLVFSKENGLIADHAITRGRDSTQAVRKVVSFTGQSLSIPDGASAFLRLSDAALDMLPPELDESHAVSASGRAQGVALTFGRGRIVVLGEAAMLTAQLGGPKHQRVGMNRPGNDDRQLALNIMHWLSRALN